MSGTIDPDGRHGGPVVRTNSSPDARFSVDWPTMPEILEDAGVTWKVYRPPGALYSVDFPEVLGVSDSVLPYFSQYARRTSPLHRRAFTPLFPHDFMADVRSGHLPQVSWIIPPIGYDEHPPAPPVLGEWFTDQVLRGLLANPSVWAGTVLFHSYDENDGFFDHVPPPVAPQGTPGEHLGVRPLPADAHGVDRPIGLGFRVPMTVISPFSRGGYVCSEVFDHTSQLRFLEERFGVRAPNLSAWRRRTVGDLTAALHLGRRDTAAPRLPSTRHDTPAAAKALGCSPLQLLGVDDQSAPVPAVPAVQHMPTQEPGRARRL